MIFYLSEWSLLRLPLIWLLPWRVAVTATAWFFTYRSVPFSDCLWSDFYHGMSQSRPRHGSTPMKGSPREDYFSKWKDHIIRTTIITHKGFSILPNRVRVHGANDTRWAAYIGTNNWRSWTRHWLLLLNLLYVKCVHTLDTYHVLLLTPVRC